MGKKKGKGAAAKAATPPAAAAAGAPPPIAPPARAAAALSLALAAAAPAGRGAASAADVAIKLAGGNNAGPRTRSTSDEAAFGSPRSADAAAAMFQGSAGESSPSPSRLLSKSNAYFAEPVLEARLVRFYLRHRLTPGAGKSAGELAAKWKDSQDALELGLLQRYGEGLRENIWLESGRQARAAQAFAAVLAICLMLVLAHFATRPNGMIGPPREFCTSTTAKPSASDPCHFSDSYWEARARFRRTATAAGLELESKAVLRGTDYTIDFAVANPHAAAAGGPLVVHISGVGGVEGYAGPWSSCTRSTRTASRTTGAGTRTTSTSASTAWARPSGCTCSSATRTWRATLTSTACSTPRRRRASGTRCCCWCGLRA